MASIVEALRHALTQFNAGDLTAAENVCRQVLEHEPQNVDALHLRGLICRKADRTAEAMIFFQQAIAIKPDRPVYWFELGIVCKQLGELEQALEANRRALALQPTMQECYVNGGATLDDLGRHEEAIEWYEKSLALKPNCKNTLINLGNVCQTLGRLDESIRSYERVIEVDPQNPHAHWNLAMALLRSGRFEQGWEEYEWRTAAGETKLDEYPQPLWDGSPLTGKSLLVHAEQGVGDEVLFASCYPDLLAQARHCTFICEPRLAPLLARSFPEATVHGYRRRHERTPCAVDQPVDVQIPAGSLPRYLRRKVADFPQRSHYLHCDPQRRASWKRRLAELGPGLKIGISWRAGGKPSEHVRRTTGLALWRRLLSLPGAHFVNLQYGEAADEIAEAREQWGVTIHDWPDADALTDLDGLAAQMSALDLVIAVGNTTVHLAGSLGVPAWSILPAYPSWRWMSDVDRVPWYTSVRLFRQRRGEGWNRVFDELHDELCDRLQIPRTAAGESGCNVVAEDESIASIPAQVSGMKFVARLTERIETAVKLHQAGDIAGAEAIYREVLKSTPQHIDALHLLGVVCQQTDRPEQGLKYLRQAIALCDTVPGFHFHLGVALKQQGAVEQAIEAYRRTLELNPKFAEAALNLGGCLQELGQLDAAIGYLQQALALQPETAGIHLNLGAAYAAQGDRAQSERHLRQALKLQADYPEAEVQLGQVLQQTSRTAEAIACFQRAVEQRPRYALAHRCLGKAYQNQQRLDEAIECYQQALELKPSDFEVLANLGLAFEQQQQFTLAADYYRRALARSPDHEQTLLHSIETLRHLGQWDEALAACSRLLAKQPKHGEALRQRAEILLARGELAVGWDQLHQANGSDAPRLRRFSMAQWDGTSLAGKSILVHGANQLVDEVQYGSCLTELIARADHCVLLCDPRLETLCSRSFPGATVKADVSFDATGDRTAVTIPHCDVQITLAGLPRLIRRSVGDFPTQSRYLVADPQQADRWRQRHASLGDGLKVGLLSNTIRKSASTAACVPHREHWRPLMSTRGVTWIDLNHAQVSLADGPGADRSIDALAARLAALDLVIGVDDFVMHLAAALGKSCWVVLPQAWEWRWGVGQTTPWYRSVRLFRAARQAAWPQVMQAVARQLERLVDEHDQHATPAGPGLPAPKFLQSPAAREGVSWQ